MIEHVDHRPTMCTCSLSVVCPYAGLRCDIDSVQISWIVHFHNETATLMTSFPVHSNGSLVIQSSLDFDLDQLEKLVKEGGSVPGEKTITAAITRVLKVDDDVTVQWVVKEPESRECHVCLLNF